MKRLGGVVLVLGCLAPMAAQAAAGKVLFTVGKVDIMRNGQVIAAARGTPVETGDTVSTGPTGMTQLRFNDGALLALRGGSSMVIEDYQLPAAMPVAAKPAMLVSALPPGAAKPDTGGQGRSVLRLVRGAFRTITGLIGKGQGDDYRVLTPAATIGIRGTDYTAAYCDGDCSGSEDGLYVGVSKGEVSVQNDAGTQDLGQNEYSYTKDAGSAPEQTTAPPAALEDPIEVPSEEESTDEDSSDDAPVGEQDSSSPSEEKGDASADGGGSEGSASTGSGSTDSASGAGSDSTGSASSGTSGTNSGSGESAWGGSSTYAGAQPATESPAPAPALTATSPSSASSSSAGTTSSAPPPVTVFQPAPGTPASYAYGLRLSASALRGANSNGVYLKDTADPGAMTGFFNASAFTEVGTAQNLNRGSDAATGIQWGRWSGGTIQSGGSPVALGTRSLHWIYALQSSTPVLPITGTATYALIGNTNPTDAAGNVGFLGAATLGADFSQMTVTSTLAIGFGSGQTGFLYNASGSGTITRGTATFAGAYGGNTPGSFNGFFTTGAAAAGLSFTLDNGVTGAAAFEKQ